MLARRRNLDAKSRRMIVMGCACLSIGLALRVIYPSTLGAQMFVQAGVGVLLGMSIVLNLFAFQLVRRRRADRA